MERTDSDKRRNSTLRKKSLREEEKSSPRRSPRKSNKSTQTEKESLEVAVVPSPTFNRLNSYDWLSVFEYLPLSDRVRIEQSSSQAKALVDRLWTSQTVLRLSPYFEHSFCPIAEHQDESAQVTVWCKGEDTSWQLKVAKRTQRLRALIVGRRIAPGLGTYVTETCSELEHFEIGPSYTDLVNCLTEFDPSNLTCLSVGYNHHYLEHSDNTYEFIKRCSAKLKHLRIHLYYFLEEHDQERYTVLERATLLPEVAPQLESLSIREFPAELVPILAQLSNLKRLALEIVELDSVGELAVLKNLSSLELENIWNGSDSAEEENFISSELIHTFDKMGRTLLELDVACILLKPEVTERLPRSCPKLQILRLAARPTDLLFKHLAQFKFIESLEIYVWPEIFEGEEDENGIVIQMNAEIQTKLTKLPSAFFDLLKANLNIQYMMLYGVSITNTAELFDALVAYANAKPSRNVIFEICEVNDSGFREMSNAAELPKNLVLDVDNMIEEYETDDETDSDSDNDSDWETAESELSEDEDDEDIPLLVLQQ